MNSATRVDFGDAHDRHWEDAELLLRSSRLANADHLYGMAVECGLKQVMIGFGMPVRDSDGSPFDRRDRVHANEIWDRYEEVRCSSDDDRQEYALTQPCPFMDWHVSDRYVHRMHINARRVAAHRDGAVFVRNLIQRIAEEDSQHDTV